MVFVTQGGTLIPDLSCWETEQEVRAPGRIGPLGLLTH